MSAPRPTPPAVEAPQPIEPIIQNRPFSIEVAERVRRLPPYLFAQINRLMYEKRRAGDDVIDLGMGNPSDPPQDLVVEKLAEAARDPKNHGYAEAQGILSLRREVAAKYFKQHGVRLDPQRELIACLGSKEGFSHLCLALLGPGDTAIVPAPSYPAHLYAVALASANAILLEVTDPQKLLANVDYTCRHMVPRPKVWIVNFPHNPSTTTVDAEFYVEAAKLAKRYGVMVVSDLAYADVTFDGYRTPSFLAAPGAMDLGVELTTMSKGYNMAGWRVGYCAGNAEMVRAFGPSRRTTTTACSGRSRSRRSWPCDTPTRRSRPSRPSTRAAGTCSATAWSGWAGRSTGPRPRCSCGPRSPSPGPAK